MVMEPKALEKFANKLGSSRNPSLMEEMWPCLKEDNRMSHSPNQLVKGLHTFQFQED